MYSIEEIEEMGPVLQVEGTKDTAAMHPGREIIETSSARPKQEGRFNVAVSRGLKQILKPFFAAADRQGAPRLVQIAEELSLIEALRLLAIEKDPDGPIKDHGYPFSITVTPTDKLWDRAEKYYVGPQLLVRAAAVKVALQLLEEEAINTPASAAASEAEQEY